MRSVVLFLLCRATVAHEIKVDWNLLTDFSTDYALDTKALNYISSRPLGAVDEHGVIQFDIHTMRMQIKADGSFVLPPPRGPPRPSAPEQFLAGKNVSYHAEFRFDATNGFASTRMHMDAPLMPNQPEPKVSFELCVKLNVPPGLVPVGAVEQKLPMEEEKIQNQLDKIPHRDGTVDGQSVAIIDNPPSPLVFKLLHNGVPVEVDLAGIPVLRFTSWHEGAGNIQEAGCNAHTSAIELLTTPGGKEVLEGLDRAMAALEMMSQLTPAGNILLPKPSVLIRDAANEELTQMQGARTFSWASTAVMGGIAGAFASAAIFAAVLRPNRQLLKEPLLIDA